LNSFEKNVAPKLMIAFFSIALPNRLSFSVGISV